MDFCIKYAVFNIAFTRKMRVDYSTLCAIWFKITVVHYEHCYEGCDDWEVGFPLSQRSSEFLLQFRANPAVEREAAVAPAATGFPSGKTLLPRAAVAVNVWSGDFVAARWENRAIIALAR